MLEDEIFYTLYRPIAGDLEGVINYFYLDTSHNLTIRIGHCVREGRVWMDDNNKQKTLGQLQPYMYKTGGIPAGLSDIQNGAVWRDHLKFYPLVRRGDV